MSEMDNILEFGPPDGPITIFQFFEDTLMPRFELLRYKLPVKGHFNEYLITIEPKEGQDYSAFYRAHMINNLNDYFASIWNRMRHEKKAVGVWERMHEFYIIIESERADPMIHPTFNCSTCDSCVERGTFEFDMCSEYGNRDIPEPTAQQYCSGHSDLKGSR